MVALVLCLASVDRAAVNPEEASTSTSAETKPTHIMNQEITNLLKAYEEALNTSDAKAAWALYGSDPLAVLPTPGRTWTAKVLATEALVGAAKARLGGASAGESGGSSTD
jgi:hypothetical protein